MSAGLAADGAVGGGRCGRRGAGQQGRQRLTAERGKKGSRPFLGNISALGKAASPSVAAAAAMGIGVGAERRRGRKREKEGGTSNSLLNIMMLEAFEVLGLGNYSSRQCCGPEIN